MAEDWFQSPENREKVKKYLDELAEVEAIERNPERPVVRDRANARSDRKLAEADRKALVKEVDAWTAGSATPWPDRQAGHPRAVQGGRRIPSRR